MYSDLLNFDFRWIEDVPLIYYLVAFLILAVVLICFPSIISWIGKAILCIAKGIAWTIGAIVETTIKAVGYLKFLMFLLGTAYRLWQSVLFLLDAWENGKWPFGN